MKDQDNDKPAFFVSRRGRQVGVHQVDLSGIDIESASESSAATGTTAKSSSSSRSRETIVTPRRPGRTKPKVPFFVILILIAVVPIIAAELVSAQYRSGISNAKNDLTNIVNTTVLPAQKKPTLSSSQVRAVANEVNDIVAHMCRGGLVDNAATLYPRASSALHECKSAQSLYASLATSLYSLESQSRYLEQVDGIIKPVATPITDEYAVIGAQQTAWQSAVEALKKVSAPASMKSAHADLLAHVSGVADAWSKLNIANNDQNTVDFEAAEKALTIEYEAVRATSPALTEVLAGTQSDILKNYSALN